MTCNRCGKEMTKEPARSGCSESWWCPFCGNTETIKKPDTDDEKDQSS